MKYLTTVFLILFGLTAYGQVGFSVAYGTSNTFGFDGYIIDGSDNRFHFGFASQSNGQKAKVVKERLANYGTTRIEDGEFFWLLDFGYSKIIKEKFTIHSELSIGQRNDFTTYEDNRFTDGGYSLVNYSKTAGGIGVYAGYLFNYNFETFVGYHTTKKLTFGVRFQIY